MGERANGIVGKVVDIISVVATVIGVATTLGFGAVQINGGLSYLFGIPTGFMTQLLIVLIVTVLFMISAMTGLGKGIKILSNVNMLLAGLLLLFMLILGPTQFILNLFTNTIGSYLQNLPAMSFRISPLNEEIRTQVIKKCCDTEQGYLKKHGGNLYPHVEDVLKKLSEKYKLYIVSNCQDGYIESFYEFHKLEKYFLDFENPGRTGLSKGENIKLIIQRNNLSDPIYEGIQKEI